MSDDAFLLSKEQKHHLRAALRFFMLLKKEIELATQLQDVQDPVTLSSYERHLKSLKQILDPICAMDEMPLK